jgi:hypothetical protein
LYLCLHLQNSDGHARPSKFCKHKSAAGGGMALPPGLPCGSEGRLMTYTYRIPAVGPDSVSISPLRGGDGPAWLSSPAQGPTYDLHLQNPGCGARFCKHKSTARGGDRAYTYGNLTGITYHLMNPCSSYLCLTETYHLQKYYLLDFCNGDLLQRGWGYLCLQKVVVTLYQPSPHLNLLNI